MKKPKRGGPARYDVLWHTPATPDPALGVRDGDYFTSGLNDITASQVRTHVLSKSWPSETIFEVTRRSRNAVARCYIEQLRAWGPNQDLPSALPIELPISRSEIIDKFRDLLNEALLFAIANGLLSDAQTREIGRSILYQVE